MKVSRGTGFLNRDFRVIFEYFDVQRTDLYKGKTEINYYKTNGYSLWSGDRSKIFAAPEVK